MFILPGIVRSGGGLGTEEFEVENDDLSCNWYVGQICIKREPTINEVGVDHVDRAFGQDGDGPTRK